MGTDNIYDYPSCCLGKVKVDSIDDVEEMQIMDEAFDILGFKWDEKIDVYRVTACCMVLSQLEFQGMGEVASPKSLDGGAKINSILNFCDSDEGIYDAFINPKYKVGTEWVCKTQNTNSREVSVGSIIKNIYGRLFRYIVDMCNNTLIDPTMKKVTFIGVLDIAGFEIFEFNTFEQICINLVNEKLQQFFNHTMFVLEQEEYMREGIVWVTCDFGMDLAACLELFEKPMGILPILEEETIYPKASDETFEAKLKAQHLGKHPNFAKAQSKTDKNAHFAVVHYAGTVSYNVTGWLNKNRDPINDTVVDLLKKTKTCALMCEIYADHPGQTKEEEDLPPPGHRRGKKRVVVKSKTAAKMANFKTVCSYFRDQLNNLINMLMTTEPSFIRCIVPNNHKKPGVVDPFLVMHQLTCNGVLEGIRICRKGFPNRIMYADFRLRYCILAPKEAYKAMKMVKRPVTDEKKNIAAAHAVMDKVNLIGDKFQYGHTKVFFRAGVLGHMEELRDDRINLLVSMLQSWIRGYFARKVYKKLWDHKRGLLCVQKCIRSFMIGKQWLWWQLFILIKPKLKSGNMDGFRKELAERIKYAQEHLEEVKIQRQVAEKKNGELNSEIEEIRNTLAGGTNAKQDLINKIAKVEDAKSALTKEVNMLQTKITGQEELIESLRQAMKKVDSTQDSLNKDMGDLERKLAQIQDDKADKDNQIKQMREELAHQEDLIAKLQREKKVIGENKLKEEEQIQTMEDKSNHLNKL